MNNDIALRELLDSEAARINCPGFVERDPVQFPRRFDKLQDIEIVSVLVSAIAWGNRKMICRDAEKLLGLMDYSPHAYLLDKGYEEVDPEMNVHRTFFGRHFTHVMRGLHDIYTAHGSLDAFSSHVRAGEAELPAWHLVGKMQKVITDANGGVGCNRCLPLNLKDTALKRFNMALRWLVRRDGIVDMGVWQSLKPSQLYIPLDVHVGNVARELGLLERRANDRKSVVELTGKLREFRPHDPVVYDFALFGIGAGE